jgi:phage terminase large subunit-like protein
LPYEASWLEDLENELFSFPRGRHDDQVDSISQALAFEISGYNLDGFGRMEWRNIFDHYGLRR